MKNSKITVLLVILLAAMLLITTCGGCQGQRQENGSTKESVKQEQTENKAENSGPQTGGVLKVAIDAEPPTIDPHASSTNLTFQVGYHIFEGLYALDEEFKPVPMLAKDLPETSKDSLQYTIKIREGIKFHNGNEVTSEDVIASLKRWGSMSKYGKAIFKNVESIEAKDKYTIVLKLTKPTGTTLVSLAMPNGGAFIYPKELCEKYSDKPLKEFIGTGPFQFVEWKPNQYIKLKRYENYQPVDIPASGYAGKKVAYVDELYFKPISDAMVRLNSVEGGECDFADFIPVDEYDRLKASGNVKTLRSAFRGWFAFNFNKKAGIMSNQKMRQAFLAALDMDPIMEAGYGNEMFWRIDPSLMFKEQRWWSDVGKEKYDQGDIEKAKQLLQEAGYNGEKIIWMSGPLEYNISLAAKNQLEKAGFNIDLQRMEWATLADRRKNPELWDVFSTGMTIKPDPTMFTAVNPNYAGWWQSPELLSLLDELAIVTNFDERYKIWEKVQKLFYEEVPTVKVGDYANFRIAGKEVQGLVNMPDIFFWNVWKQK